MKPLEQDALYRTYYPKVMQYVQGKIQLRQEAEDVVSQVFLKVFEKLSTYQAEKASLSTWIYTITGNTVIDYYRKQKLSTVPFEELTAEPITETGEALEERLAWLSDALTTLPERQRDAVLLHYYFGLSHEEIGSKLQTSSQNARKLCSLGVKALRERMQEMEG